MLQINQLKEDRFMWDHDVKVQFMIVCPYLNLIRKNIMVVKTFGEGHPLLPGHSNCSKEIQGASKDISPVTYFLLGPIF